MTFQLFKKMLIGITLLAMVIAPLPSLAFGQITDLPVSDQQQGSDCPMHAQQQDNVDENCCDDLPMNDCNHCQVFTAVLQFHLPAPAGVTASAHPALTLQIPPPVSLALFKPPKIIS